MGTYTTNYNLFMPSIGEQGWGTLVNGNFTTIDTTMMGLSNRITAVESEVNGNLSCTSVTTSGTIISTGKITSNGGIECKSLTATSISNSGNMTNTGTLTSTGMIYANGGINADLSPCFGFTSESGVISAIKFDTAIDTFTASKTNGNITRTYTYRENPICNDITFVGAVTGYSMGSSVYKATGNVKINGTTVMDVQCNPSYPYNNGSTHTTTLHEGDIITASGTYSGDATATITMKCIGYLTSNYS